MFVNPAQKQSSQTFVLITRSCSSNNNTLKWLANNSSKNQKQETIPHMSDQFNKKVIKASYFSNQVTKTNFTNNNMT